MATTKVKIEEWLNRAKEKNATHMIVVCDTFDHEDYPVFVLADENVQDKLSEYRQASMQRVMECYKLSISLEEQLNEYRAFNI